MSTMVRGMFVMGMPRTVVVSLGWSSERLVLTPFTRRLVGAVTSGGGGFPFVRQ